jgi:hypothetical protein
LKNIKVAPCNGFEIILNNNMDIIFVPVKTLMGRLAPISVKLSFTPDGLWKVSLKDEHRTSNVQLARGEQAPIRLRQIE